MSLSKSKTAGQATKKEATGGGGSRSSLNWWWFAVLAVLVAYIWVRAVGRRANVPAHLSNHPVRVIADLIPTETAAELVQLMKEFEAFTSNVDQSKAQGFTPRYDDIGESQEIQPDGTCSHPFLFPNANKTRCHLPQRVDIGKHFIMTGGVDGLKESYRDLVDRVSSFGRYTFPEQLDDYPAVKGLFESKRFQSAARSVCPADKQFLDPFQFNYIIQVPGQTVALHIDSPYFYGADRYSFPQWFLVAMVWSGLFQHLFVDQVQVVGYLHEWTSEDVGGKGGDFLWYDNSTSYQRVLPAPRSGSVVDGSKMLHAATVYRRGVKAPHLEKNSDNVLQYVGDDVWEVRSDGATVQAYTTKDLRISIVYRARCFRDEAALREYKDQASEVLNLDGILDQLVADLVAKGKIAAGSTKDSIGRLELALLLIDAYITYPLPPQEFATVPFNLCAATIAAPWLGPVFSWFC